MLQTGSFPVPRELLNPAAFGDSSDSLDYVKHNPVFPFGDDSVNLDFCLCRGRSEEKRLGGWPC